MKTFLHPTLEDYHD